MTRIKIMDPANPARDGWHSITDIYGKESDSLNGNIKMIFLTRIPTSVPTNTQRQPDDWSCGPYAMAEALNRSGEDMRRWLQARGLIGTEYGTVHDGINQCIRAQGYACNFGSSYLNGRLNPAEYQSVINNLRNGYKVILLMGGTKSVAGGACRNNYWSRAGHYVTAYAIDDGSSTKSPASTTTKADYKFTVSQISHGSTGRDVRLWQRLLCGRGFTTAIDGEFGDNCQAKTIAFQKALKIKADGIVGINTWRAMIPCYSDVVGTGLTFSLSEITYGSQGAEAYFLQNLLKGYGYTIGLDFTYGDKCATAAREWKSRNGLDPKDLSCGKNTFSRLIGK